MTLKSLQMRYMAKTKLSIFKVDATTSKLLPLASSVVKAGFPSPAEDFVENKLNLNELVVKNPAATFFVRVDGNSMKDAHIFHDDILVVDRSLPCEDKKIVVAIINSEFTVKRIRINNGKIFLEPENKEFDLIEITPNMDFEVWGVVSYIIHKAL